MPVLIQIPSPNGGNYYGTGVFLTDSNKVFLVTASHVIFATNTLELKGSNAVLSAFGQGTSNKNVLNLKLRQLLDDGRMKRHARHDVAVIHIGNIRKLLDGRNWIDWVDSVSRPPDNPVFVTWTVKDVCKLFKDIPDGNDTYILGYPVELLNTHIHPEVDFASPLIRRGIISQRNHKTGTLIIDSGVYGGNSGGPVLIVEPISLTQTAYKIGGLITQFVPVFTRIDPEGGITTTNMINSGYSVAEPIDYALELMRQ
jgi:hypothetical protein